MLSNRIIFLCLLDWNERYSNWEPHKTMSYPKLDSFLCTIPVVMYDNRSSCSFRACSTFGGVKFPSNMKSTNIILINSMKQLMSKRHHIRSKYERILRVVDKHIDYLLSSDSPGYAITGFYIILSSQFSSKFFHTSYEDLLPPS